MVTKTITYTDYNGETRTETLYFNLTQMELTEMAYADRENLTDILNKAIAENDTGTIVRFLKKFIISAYGEKSSDGRFFLKSEEKKNSFACSAAFSALFEQLASSEKDIEAFITSVVPSSLAPDKLTAAADTAK